MKITLDTLTKATRQLALENKKSDELDTELPEEVKAFFADDMGLDDDEVLNTEKEPEDGKKADDEPKDAESEDKDDAEGDTAADALADLKDAALDDTDKDAEIADAPDLDDEDTVLDLSAGKKDEDDEDKGKEDEKPEEDDKDDKDKEKKDDKEDDEDKEPADECNKAEHDAILVNEDEECKTVKVHVYDIDWDTSDEKHWDDDQPLDVDDEDDEEHWDDDQIDDSEPMQDDMNARAKELGLPSETDLEVVVCPGDDMDEVIADALSDEYDYCVNGFNFDVISDDGEVDESALGDAFKSIGQGIGGLLKTTLKGAAVLIAGLGGSFLFGLPGLLLAVCIAFGLMSAKESAKGVEVDEGLLGGVKDKLKTVIGVLKADPKKSKELNDKMLAAKKAGDKEAMKKIAGEVKALAGNGGKTPPDGGKKDEEEIEVDEGGDCCECDVAERHGEFRRPKFKRDKWSDGPRSRPRFDDEEDDYADDYADIEVDPDDQDVPVEVDADKDFGLVAEEGDKPIDLKDVTADQIKAIADMDPKAREEMSELDPETQKQAVSMLGIEVAEDDEGKEKHTYIAYFDTSVPADAPAEGFSITTDQGDEYAVSVLAQVADTEADYFPLENVTKDDEDWYDEYNEILNRLMGEDRVFDYDYSSDDIDWIGMKDDGDDEEDEDEVDLEEGDGCEGDCKCGNGSFSCGMTKDVSTVAEMRSFLRECGTFRRSPSLRRAVSKFTMLMTESPRKAQALVDQLDHRFKGMPVTERRFCETFVKSI